MCSDEKGYCLNIPILLTKQNCKNKDSNDLCVKVKKIISKMTMSTECVLPRGNYLFREPVIQDVTGVAVSLMSVMVYLKWSSVCIIHDDETGMVIQHV